MSGEAALDILRAAAAARPSDQRRVTIDAVLSAREMTHGYFPDCAAIIQAIKEQLRAGSGWAELAVDQKEALDQIASKMGRSVNGAGIHIDTWTDIAGYARLIERRLHSQDE